MTFEEAEAKMTEAGAEHGRAAATWHFDGNTTEATYRRVLRGLEDGDPEIMDTLPSSPLSGEWDDEPTPASVFADVLGIDRWSNHYWGFDARDDLLDAYEQGFYSASQEAIHVEADEAVEHFNAEAMAKTLERLDALDVELGY